MVSKAKADSETPENESGESSGEVVKGIQWGQINDISAARTALEQAYGAVLDSSVLFGDGSEFLKDKDVLVGSPFVVCDFRFVTDEKTGNEYVNVLIMGRDGSKARFNDGGTGVYAQLKQVHQEYGVIGIQCKNGLRKSEYEKEVDGKTQRAVTYYLSS